MQGNFERDTLFKQYHETRSQFLDGADQEKLTWFTYYFDTIYAPYFKKVSNEQSILELGCNKGYLLKTFSDKGYVNLTGVDLSCGDLEIAKKIIPTANLIQTDIFTFLEESEQYFDVIILKALIEHIEKNRIMELLEKIYKRLAPEGVVLIDVYNADWWFAQHERYMDFTHEVGFTRESLRQVMIFFYKDVSVIPVSTSFIYNKKRRFISNVGKKIVKKICEFLDPDLKDMPIFERSLIGYGKK